MSELMTSTKPYIVRAFYQWIFDNQLTPYIVVDVNVYGVMVPMSYVNDGEITLNISISAVGSISMEGDTIEFGARFGGKLEHLVVPYGAISAIFAKENGAGTSLNIEHPKPKGLTDVNVTAKTETLASVESKAKLSTVQSTEGYSEDSSEESKNKLKNQAKSKPKGRVSLKIIK